MKYRLLFLVLSYNSVYAIEESLRALDQKVMSRNFSKREKQKYVDCLLPLVKNIKSVCQSNSDFGDCHKKINFTLPLLKKDIPYRAFNPSIIKTNEGYDVMCRTANWLLPGYRPIIARDTKKNKIFFLRYDKSFKLVYEQEITIPPHLLKNISENYKVADCRIFHWDGSCWFIGNSLIPGYKELPKIALCKFDCFDGVTPTAVQSLQLFHGPNAKRTEKNWMPVVDGEKLKFIYSYDPFVLLEPNIEDGTCKELLRYTPPLDLSRWRGSAAPIEFDGGYLMMVHERLRTYVYVHRFVYLDKNFRMTKYSDPFTFTHLGVEFCAAMAIDHTGKNLVVPVGIEDKEAIVLLVELSHVRELLYPMPTQESE